MTVGLETRQLDKQTASCFSLKETARVLLTVCQRPQKSANEQRTTTFNLIVLAFLWLYIVVGSFHGADLFTRVIGGSARVPYPEKRAIRLPNPYGFNEQTEFSPRRWCGRRGMPPPKLFIFMCCIHGSWIVFFRCNISMISLLLHPGKGITPSRFERLVSILTTDSVAF